MLRKHLASWVKHRVKGAILGRASLTAPAVAYLRAAGLPRYANALVREAPVPDTVWVSVPQTFPPAVFKLLSSGGRDFVADAVWREGLLGFERPLPAIFATLVKAAGPTLTLDIGANTGFYALLASAVNKRTRVHAFEPFDPVYRLLRAHCLENASERIETFNVAVSDVAGTTRLYVPLQNHGLIETSASLESDFKDAHSAVIEVERVTIDRHLAGTKATGPVGVMKIDVEGHENEVLRGARETITRDRPALIIEVLEKLDCGALNAFLRELDYVSYRIEDGKLVAEPEVRCIFRVEAWNHLALPREASRPHVLDPFFSA